MGYISETIDSAKSLQIRQVLTQCDTFGMIVTSARKALMCFTGSESPVVVLSGSMEPGFKMVHEREDTGKVDVLTKGDNNYGDDRALYAHGQLWLNRHHIMCRAVGYGAEMTINHCGLHVKDLELPGIK